MFRGWQHCGGRRCAGWLMVAGLCVSIAACRGGAAVGAGSAPSGTAAQPPPLASLPPTLVLVQSTAKGAPSEILVELQYDPQPMLTRPRTMELFLQISPNLTLLGATPGAAALAAGKQVMAQPAGSNQIRTVLSSSTNMLGLDGGALVEYRFQKSGGGAARVALLREKPIFEPSPANAGVVLGEPLDIP